MTKWTISTAMLLAAYTLSAQEGRVTVPKIWDGKALEDWATPIAALGVRPSQFTAAEYYAVPDENLRTYPVYRPDREPSGYWEWLQKQKPQPLVDTQKLRTREEWIRAGEIAFQTIGATTLATGLATADPEKIKLYRDPKAYEGVWTRTDGSLLVARWVVTDHGIELRAAACAGCHARAREDGTVFWAAPRGPIPGGKRDITLLPLTPADIEPAGIRSWRLFTVPWAPDERIENCAMLLMPRLWFRQFSAFAFRALPAGPTGTRTTRPRFQTSIIFSSAGIWMRPRRIDSAGRKTLRAMRPSSAALTRWSSESTKS